MLTGTRVGVGVGVGSFGAFAFGNHRGMNAFNKM